MKESDVLKKFNEILTKNINFDKLSHSYLIETNYSNTELLSKEFINRILKEKYNDIKIDDLYNSGYIISFGLENKPMKVDDVYLLQEQFSKKAIDGNPYIYIIYNSEMINTSSSNKMLKFLEEPEEIIYAILFANNKNIVSETILSRCQIISFMINENEFVNQKNEDMDFLIDFVCKVEKYKEASIAYLNKEFYTYFEDRNKLNQFMNNLLYIYNDLLHSLLLDNINYFNQYKEEIFRLTNNNNVKSINDKINVVSEMIVLLKYNPNIKLYFDKLVIRLSGVDKNE